MDWGSLFSSWGMLWALLGSVGLAVFARDLALGVSPLAQVLHVKVRLHYAHWQRELGFVRSRCSAEHVLGWQGLFGVSGLLAGLVFSPWNFVLVLAVFVPPLVLRRVRHQRVAALEQQIEAWIGSLARALEAAPSLGEAVEATILASVWPMAQELEQVVSEMHLGLSLERALVAWERRVNSQVLSLALSILQIGRQTGGSLPQVLKDAAASLREMERLQGVIRTKTAEGRAQSMVIGGMPIPMCCAMHLMDPHHFDPLRYTPVGQVLVGLATLLWVAALLSMKKILAVRI